MKWLMAIRTLSVAGLVLAAAALASCVDDPMGPEVSLDDQVAGSLMNSPAIALSPGALNTDIAKSRRSADKDALKDFLKAEKDRLKAKKDATKEEQKARKEQWKVTKKLAKKAGGWASFLEFLTCEPLDYDYDSDIIGPDGGSLKVGPHEIDIPKGALDDYVLVTAELPLTEMVEIQLEPHGLTFNKDVELTLSYKHCFAPENQWHWMVYIDSFDNILEWPMTWDKKSHDEVVADIEHFSRYAVVAN